MSAIRGLPLLLGLLELGLYLITKLAAAVVVAG
jgi:hypothetical protein